MPETPWDLLQAGDKNEAFRQLRENSRLKGTPSQIMELGVAYLWAQEYQTAWEHFDSANQRHPRQTAVYYGMAGAAKWCLSNAHEAVQQWLGGLNCRFADAAGGVGLPLLLFFASIVRPEVFDRAEAEKLVLVRAEDPRARNWPGALAEYVSGRIDASDLRSRCVGRDESDTMLRYWLTDFYIGVFDHSRGNVKAFMELMRRTATTSHEDFDVAEGHYLGKLWHPEFFLGRHEAARFESQRTEGSGFESQI